MEIWTVVGIDTKAVDKNKTTGDHRLGVKIYLVGENFEPDQGDRYIGQVCSALFLTHDERKRFAYDPMPGDRIQVAYNRWGRVSLFAPVK